MLRELRVLARAGLLRPELPRSGYLGLAARARYLTPNLSTGVALHSARAPRRAAVIDDRGALTWAQLDERASRLANALLARAEPSDRVAVLCRNGREMIECYAGIGRAGMTAVPLDTWAVAPELDHIAKVQNLSVIVHAPEFAGTVDELTWAGVRLVTGRAGSYEQAIRAAPVRAPRVKGSSRIVTHTSGTTGAPKGAERDVRASGAAQLLDFLERVPLHRDDRLLIAPPLFHAFAQGLMAVAVVLGTTIVLRERFDPADFAATVRRHDVTAAGLVPVMLRRIADGGEPLPTLRIVITSGSALTRSLRDRAEALLGPVVYDLYGSTEAGFAAIATPHDHGERPGSVGRPGRSVHVVITDDRGRSLPAGEIGHIVVTTPMAFSGYTGSAQGSSGGIDMGDLGFLDAQGRLFVTGRSDEMVISGGKNLYPSEVEEALAEHPDLLEAAVMGVPDDEYGQVLHAFVVARPGAPVTEESVRSFLREHVARYKVPKVVRFMDALPRTTTGKVKKRELPVSP